MELATLSRIKQWHVGHQHDHPVEYCLFDAMLTIWVVGWVGWVPAFMFDALWMAPLCVAAMATPALYVSWRLKAHRERKLRCDWAVAV